MKNLMELKPLLQKNNRYAILENETDIVNEIDRLFTSREIERDIPAPNRAGKAEGTGFSRITIGKYIIKAYYHIWFWGWDDEEKQYDFESSEMTGWEMERG